MLLVFVYGEMLRIHCTHAHVAVQYFEHRTVRFHLRSQQTEPMSKQANVLAAGASAHRISMMQI